MALTVFCLAYAAFAALLLAMERHVGHCRSAADLGVDYRPAVAMGLGAGCVMVAPVWVWV